MKQALSLYKTGDFAEVFQLIRVWDAPYDAIEKYLPKKGIVVDLGCGDGLLANYIALSRPQSKVYGVDLNKDRIKDAQKGLRNAKFVHGDIAKSKVPKADVIILAHVLHHLLSKDMQEKVLGQCRAKLKPNGKLIIIEIGYQPLHKYLLTWFVDAVVVPILFEGRLINLNFYYRSTNQWKTLFKKMGMKSVNFPAHKNKPFSHEVFISTMNKGK